ncbi:amidophosphoribosyltransferase protein [Dioscorea alata]|uniref:Amidophosphoribosyltransferase protein n=1 Tax=Dioscorea alata TaxID=55571 RepID=A0ACB7USK4_DIOAL|nr:amidophosphoribosyltransferase protein [Dioscorea alata]
MAASTSSLAVILFSPRNPNPKFSLLSFPKSMASPHLHLRHRVFTPISATAASPQTVVMDFDLEKPREECGVVGIAGHPEAAQLCSLALHALQHRGQEGAGIAASDFSTIRYFTGLGLVSEVFNDSRSLLSLPGSSAIGHVRYSTAGAASALQNVQPFRASYRFGQLAVAHNGNLVNYPSLRASLEDQGSIFNTSSDTEAILHLIATSKSRPFLSRVAEACSALRGAYSLLFLTADKLLAVRDPHGFRPLVLGRLPRNNGAPPAIVFASETCALDLIGAQYEREVEPGEVVIVDTQTLDISTACLIPSKPRKACVFELIYFSLPQSIVFGRPVHQSRCSFGATLAAESPAPGADVVIPVPDSGFFAARGFAERSGLPFHQGLIRSHYVGRTFIQPSQEIRDLGVKLKLSPIRGILEGKSVVVVDDSIVRGTTSKKIVNLLRDAGAREVHMRIASPPIIGSCYYGVDTARPEELVSNRMDVEGVRKEIGADSLAFLSLDSLNVLLGDEAPAFCDACFTRDYPVPPAELVEAKAKELLCIN